MEFLYSNFLWALFAILIPIIIHLFYFKRFKKVYFSDIRFLKEIKEETKNRNKLKNILVLLSRILAIVFLVLAFAQPYIPSGKKQQTGTKGVSIFVDNSFSMQSLSEDVPLLEKAKKISRDIVNGYDDDVQFQILTNRLFGVEQKWLQKSNALEKIDEITLTPSIKSFEKIYNRQKQAFDKAEIQNKISYWITDLQQNVFDITSSVIDTTIDNNLVVVQPVQEKNISIDSCYWNNPVPVVNQTNKLLVKITNNSEVDAENIAVKINYNNEIYPSGKIDIKANSYAIDTIDFRIKNTGWNEIKISITDYPIVFDDEYYISFNVPSKIQVLNINDYPKSNDYLKAAFAQKDFFVFEHQNVNRVDYSNLSKYKLIILEDIKSISTGFANTLREVVERGANLIIFPNKSVEKESINNFLNSVNANIIKDLNDSEAEASNLNSNEFVFKNVYDKINKNIKPIEVKAWYSISNFQSKRTYNIIKFKSGEPFIDRYGLGKGNIYFCVSPLSEKYNDLVSNADIFVPLLFKMSIASDDNERLSYTVGQDNNIEVEGVNTSDKGIIYFKGKNVNFIPKQFNANNDLKLSVNDQISEQGFYSVIKEGDLIKKIAFNYDRTESALKYIDESKIEENFGEKLTVYGKNKSNRINFAETINSKEKGIQLWKWAAILALVFIAFEILLLRFWKTR